MQNDDDSFVGESRPKKDEERRRSPRFSVGGWGTIHRLPLEGKAIPAVVRNLSVGGVCLDVGGQLELGDRTEMLLCVDAACFRAAALVREQRGFTRTCLEFVQISQGAKSVLEELIDHLAKLQMLTRKLRSGQMEEGMAGKLLDAGRFRIMAVGKDEGSATGEESGNIEGRASSSEDEAESRIVQLRHGLIQIDLFG